jgi:putative endonuclease
VSDRKAAEIAGRSAEGLAALMLLISGYVILARRWRCVVGEIDIIARKGKQLIFVEIKFRRRLENWHGITRHQQQRISRAAELYVAQKGFSPDFEWRFDVILLHLNYNVWPPLWRHYKNAWQASR